MASITETENKIRGFLDDPFYSQENNAKIASNLKANVEIAISKIIASYKESGFDNLNAFCSNETGSASVTAYAKNMFIDLAIHSETDIDFEVTSRGADGDVETDETKFGVSIDEACKLIKSFGRRLK